MVRIDAKLLIPGRGEPLRDGTVVLDAGKISYVGARSAAPEAAETVTVETVMPGLWDCHTHVMGLRPAGGVFEQLMSTPDPVLVARAVKDLEAALDAGVTSVRDVGGFGTYLARVIEEGTFRGPTVYAAGAILSMTGGHGDAHAFPLSWAHDACARSGVMRLCDGVPECLKAVREQLRRGARLIKVCASGGVMSELDHPIHQQFSLDELRAIVEEAGRADRAVAAHCHGKPGIVAALRAGVRTIEHGSYLDEECAAMMREAGAILVPTRFIVERLLRHAKASMPEYIWTKTLRIAERHAEAIRIAHAAGVRIASGTDIYSAFDRRDAGVPWGLHGAELRLLVDHGLAPLEAIEAATATAPETLGPQAPRSGRLAVGWDADVIAVAGDPVADVGILSDAARVTHVWKAGTAVKAPSIGRH